MPTDDEDPKIATTSRSDAALSRIANLLGCTVETFLDDGDVSDETRDLRDLIGFWTELETRDDRKLVLDLARRLAGRDTPDDDR